MTTEGQGGASTRGERGQRMGGRPLKVVVSGDSQTAALKLAADLDECGMQPAFFFAAAEDDLDRLVPDSELIVAWHPAAGLPAARVLELWAGRAGAPPIVVYGEAFEEHELIALMRAGARDCLRRGDLARVRAAFERETGEALAHRSRGEGDPGDRYRALIEEIPALT